MGASLFSILKVKIYLPFCSHSFIQNQISLKQVFQNDVSNKYNKINKIIKVHIEIKEYIFFNSHNIQSLFIYRVYLCIYKIDLFILYTGWPIKTPLFFNILMITKSVVLILIYCIHL